MGVRFRFKSDSSCKTRGWMLDNIKIAGADKTYYDPNSCNNMKDFIVYGDSIYGKIGGTMMMHMADGYAKIRLL